MHDVKKALDIQRVFADHPGLGVHGFGTLPPEPHGDFQHQVYSARSWIEASRVRAMVAMRRGDSYRLKHVIEDATGRYISNGACIVAAVLAGFRAVRATPGSTNCNFLDAAPGTRPPPHR